MSSHERPVAIDCFAGAGGLSLGLVQAGFGILAAFDNSPEAVETYRRNIGEHVRCVSVDEIDGKFLLNAAGVERGECALLAGGPPCQGFSRQRRGPVHDLRNDLVLRFMELVLDIAPTMFLMENVAAIGGPRGRSYLEEFRARAGRAGYVVHEKVLDAADYGVPQRRRRMFVVGERSENGGCFRFPEPTHGRGSYRTVRDAIGDLPAPGADLRLANHEPDRISRLNRLRISHVPPGGGRADIPPELRLPCHEVSVDKAGHRGVYGRLNWDEPSGTITTKCNSFTRGRFAHPTENRNITMREAARLQSFPDEFAFVGHKIAVAHQVGNAVPPLLAQHLGLAIRAALNAPAQRLGNHLPPHQLRLAL